jgi:hypothetical protein
MSLVGINDHGHSSLLPAASRRTRKPAVWNQDRPPWTPASLLIIVLVPPSADSRVVPSLLGSAQPIHPIADEHARKGNRSGSHRVPKGLPTTSRPNAMERGWCLGADSANQEASNANIVASVRHRMRGGTRRSPDFRRITEPSDAVVVVDRPEGPGHDANAADNQRNDEQPKICLSLAHKPCHVPACTSRSRFSRTVPEVPILGLPAREGKRMHPGERVSVCDASEQESTQRGRMAIAYGPPSRYCISGCIRCLYSSTLSALLWRQSSHRQRPPL